MNILCDHQTGYLPWLGLFHRISLCDIYVSLDTVKYQPSTFDDRNRIKTPQGPQWLKVPTIKPSGTSASRLLKDIKINNALPWRDEHLKAIRASYGGLEFFDGYFDSLQKILHKNHDSLMDLNEDLLKFFLHELAIEVKFHKASERAIAGKSNEYLINLCKEFKADAYVFGQMGHEYAQKDLWKANAIKLYFHKYHHPTYPQKFGDFEGNLSIIDLLFNCGRTHSRRIFREGNITRKEMMGVLE